MPPDHDYIINAHGDAYLREVNPDSFGKKGAKLSYTEHFGEQLFLENALYIIIGSDSGRLISFIREHGEVPGTRYLFVEDPDLYPIIAQHPATPQDEAWFRLCDTDHWLQAADDFKLDHYIYVEGVYLLKSLGAQDQHYVAYADISLSIDQALIARRFSVIASLSTQRYMLTQFRNMADNLFPASQLRNLYRGRTAVLLAGGPSLDQSLEWLQIHRNQVVVLAVSRIMNRLNDSGIVADYIFTVDPTSMSMDVSLGCFEVPPQSTLIYSYHTYPLIVSQFPGPSFYLGPLLPWKSRLNTDNLPSVGPTVTNTALFTAQAMGFTTVILAGVDLCFSAEGYCHAEGSAERDAGPKMDRKGIWVETQSGKLAATTTDFAHALESLKLQVHYLVSKGMTLINPSPDAAKVEGIRFIAWNEISLKPNVLSEAPLQSNTPHYSEARQRAHIQALQRELAHAKRALSAIARLASLAMKLNRRFYQCQHWQEARHTKTRMDKLQRRISCKYRRFTRLTKEWGILSFLRIISPHVDLEQADAALLEKQGAAYYEEFMAGTAALIEALTQCEPILHTRLLETVDPPNLPMLAKRWEAFDEPGRGRVWALRHPGLVAKLTPEDIACLGALEASFARQKLQRKTTRAAYVADGAHPQHSLTNARYDYAHRQIEPLQQVRHSLACHPDQETASAYQPLIEAYLCHLQEGAEPALGFIMEQLIPKLDMTPSPLLIHSLMLAASLAATLERWDLLITTLECLAQCTPHFMPQYAEALRLTGQYQRGVGILLDYLERVPEDIRVQKQLAQLYLDGGVPEAASILLDHIKANEV